MYGSLYFSFALIKNICLITHILRTFGNNLCLFKYIRKTFKFYLYINYIHCELPLQSIECITNSIKDSFGKSFSRKNALNWNIFRNKQISPNVTHQYEEISLSCFEFNRQKQLSTCSRIIILKFSVSLNVCSLAAYISLSSVALDKILIFFFVVL